MSSSLCLSLSAYADCPVERGCSSQTNTYHSLPSLLLPNLCSVRGRKLSVLCGRSSRSNGQLIGYPPDYGGCLAKKIATSLRYNNLRVS